MAGLVWSPVGRTATRMGSAQPTRLPAGSGLPSGTVSSPRSITRPLICRRCGTSSFFLLMVNPSFIRRHSIWRAVFSACHLAWDTALKAGTRKAATLTSMSSSQTRRCGVRSGSNWPKRLPILFGSHTKSFWRRSPRWRLNARDHAPKKQSLGECPAWQLQFVSSRTVG